MGKRVFVIVIDSLGVGALPDAGLYNDSPSVNTLGNIDARVERLSLPALESLGLGHILSMRHVEPVLDPAGFYGKMAERSPGKDTTTGHWEMMGICLDKPFPLYPEGFPTDLIQAFIEKTGCGGILGNTPASGTEIIALHGVEHLETGYPIVYTSADSVFQIAAHVKKVPLETLYHWCSVARELLRGEHEVSRVIARPFTGKPGAFERLGSDRRDYAISPPPGSCLERIQQRGGIVLGIGKIEDIFCSVGLTHSVHTKGNSHGLDVTGRMIRRELDLDSFSITNQPIRAYNSEKQFIFTNLVDTDMKYGHRRDVLGYANALEEIDQALGDFIRWLEPGDLLMITGDHGCDPTAPGSDHTREYVPILMASSAFAAGGDLGVRESFADVGKTVLAWLQPEAEESGILGKSLLISALLKM